MKQDKDHFFDTKILSRILGSRDLDPESEDSIQEVEAELKDLGYDLDKLNREIWKFKKKLAGKLAIKQAAAARKLEEKKKQSISFPQPRHQIIKQIRAMGFAARQTDQLTDKDLLAIYEGLEELRELEQNKADGDQQNQS